MAGQDRTISYVEPNSYAYEAGLVPGDILEKVNGQIFQDILEYRYLISEPEIEIEVKKTDGSVEIITIENDFCDIGIEFRQGLIDTAQSCKNKCIFCFIDQLPKGMRETVYFKDEDTRLSFLQGNYVTLTNLKDEDIDRLIALHISPINISVHTTNPELRVLMLKNPNASKIYDIMQKFAENNIYMNCQIVLCKNVNDKEHLFKSLDDLTSMYPAVNSISVVPCGLSDHRDGLFKIEPFTKEDAAEIISSVSSYQEKLLEKHGSRIVFLSDEFYLKADMPLPEFEHYEDFPQIENGVGLLASFKDEFDFALENIDESDFPGEKRHVSVATGKAAYGFIKTLASEAENQTDSLKIDVYEIENTVFGKNITVAGLLCGRDIVSQLKDKDLGDELLISKSTLRSGEDVLLDDMRVGDIAKALNIKVTPTENDGEAFLYALLGLECPEYASDLQNPYELSHI